MLIGKLHVVKCTNIKCGMIIHTALFLMKFLRYFFHCAFNHCTDSNFPVIECDGVSSVILGLPFRGGMLGVL